MRYAAHKLTPMASELRIAAVIRLRGLQPLCDCCRKDCKVVKGSPGTAATFVCLDYEADPGRGVRR